MELVTPEMLAAVREVGESGLTTDVTVLTRTLVEGENGNDDQEVWASTSTVKAWIYQNDNGPVLHIGDGAGVVSSIGRYRINLPYTTSVDEGDMLGLTGQIFMVNEVNSEDTLRVFTTVIARKRD